MVVMVRRVDVCTTVQCGIDRVPVFGTPGSLLSVFESGRDSNHCGTSMNLKGGGLLCHRDLFCGTKTT
jgi:hypothetical protein